ncbi:RagB/SusD family nutrient uptake outer membrane protein [Bacteroides sp.]
MKTKIKYAGILLTFATTLLFLGGCEDMLETDSSRVAFEDDNQLGSPNDSIYSVMGILSQLQKVGERYVVLGELRGDLMTVSDEAPFSLKEINNFDVTSENTYLNKRDYYTIINNCNYAIARMDTAITIRNEKVMLPEFAAIKTIRAWTYFQLAQAFGSVNYITEPILDYEAALKQYPVIGMDDLVSTLIADLLPYINVRSLNYGFIDEQSSALFFIPVPMLLGDLYLYQNQYAKAADMYHKLMVDRSYSITETYANFWNSLTREEATYGHLSSYSSEVITKIAYSSVPKDYHADLVNMSYNDAATLLPTIDFVDEMALKTHFFATKLNGDILARFEGDLRGTIRFPLTNREEGDAFETVNIRGVGTTTLITKFLYGAKPESTIPVKENNNLLATAYIQTGIPLYRHPHLYLRFAEAVNRAGKPTLAFAVLKYGLTEETINDPAMVNPAELTGESYLDFSFTTTNVGTACRGLGLGVSKDVSDYVIPDFSSVSSETAHQDSIDWVEEKILEEMAAETSYEGNRFFDLLRISRHRADHPAFMAEKVAAKFDDPKAMKNKLMDLNVWFLK